MAMPNELVLVRHGHSEGNFVADQSKLGDDSFYTPDFTERPGHQWRLTEEGREQARQTGAWILENIGRFDRYYLSPYIRTKETAGLLDLPDVEWRVDPRLRERDWGDIGALSRKQFQQEYPRNATMKEIDALYWRPPGGESIMDVRLRVRSLLDTLHREMAGKRVLIVTHGEFMWATRAELEYMSDVELLAADKDPAQKIPNGEVLQYTRIDPNASFADKILPWRKTKDKYLHWTRSVCPWMDEINLEWREIERKRFTNEELLSHANEVDPIIT